MKQAVLIGINYKGTNAALSGCINDTHNVKKMLLEQYGYEEKNIKMLTDETEIKPTRDNIITTLIDLALELNTNDTNEVWIHYSGHGAYVPDLNGDELDGQDEVLVPIDYHQNGMITDDMIKYILKKINRKLNVMIVFDCCHAGTLADLPYSYRNEKETFNKSNSSLVPNVIMISGCKDDQTSADAKMNGKWSGALTHCMLKCLERNNYTVSNFELLKDVRDMLKVEGFEQYPVLSCSSPIEKDSLFSVSKKNKPFIN